MDLLSSTLDGIGQVGSALDKYTGGRAVRGALAGKTRELASIVPFSDTLGLTNEHDATSGRDLLDHYGITAKGDNSLGAHAAGFLVDNVLSPANWIGAGAAFKAAPTLAKGLSSGAKALSGLDLADHMVAGAKGIGSAAKAFAHGESGAVNLDKFFPSSPHAADEGLVAAVDAMHAKTSALKASKGIPDTEYGHYLSPDELAHENSLFGDALNNDDSRVHAGEETWHPDAEDYKWNSFVNGSHEKPTSIPVVQPLSSPSNPFANRRPAAQVAQASDPISTILRSVEGKVNNKIGNYGQYGGAAYNAIDPGDIKSPLDAQLFAEKMDRGLDAAGNYYGQTYYHLNKHLRGLGDKVPEQIAALRSSPEAGLMTKAGEYVTPSQNPSSELQNAISSFKQKYSTDPTDESFTGLHPYQLKAWGGGAKTNEELLANHFGDLLPEYQQHIQDIKNGKSLGIPEYAQGKISNTIAGLMDLLDHSRLPTNTPMYRGVDGPGVSAIEEILGAKLNSPEAVGREFTDPAFLSGSPSYSTAEEFAGLRPGYYRPQSGVTFDFGELPAGKQAAMMNSAEYEYLFPPGRKIKITDNSQYPRIKAELYAALLASMAGMRAAHGGFQQQPEQQPVL